jgi:glucosamine 6-phosphate synthetase-like amidotransferase/phosphosugar isomerase protein
MCGIFGFIGESKDPKLTFEFSNQLMIATEKRGGDATGFWGTENNRSGNRLFYDKEAVKSSIYINNAIWKNEFAKVDCDLLLSHCRATSAGGGTEKINKNNHPHVSIDKKIALIHNGKIDDYHSLKEMYDLKSDCDSEILLTMFESFVRFEANDLAKEYPDVPIYIARRMAGMKEIFKHVNQGKMAVAIGERDDANSRRLWLFRNDERPLTVVDLTSSLGQYFFCSTPEIWLEAVNKSPNFKKFIPGDSEIMDFPSDHFWLFDYDATRENPWYVKSYKVTMTKYTEHRLEKDMKVKYPRTASENSATSFQIITRLDNSEDVKLSLKTQEAILSLNDVKTQSSCCEAKPNEAIANKNIEEVVTQEQMDNFQKEIKSIRATLSEVENLLLEDVSATDEEVQSAMDCIKNGTQEINALVSLITTKTD